MTLPTPTALARLLRVAILALPALGLGAPLHATAAVQEVASPDEGRATVERLIELAREETQVHEHLRYLCEEIGPRLSSSGNLERAEKWCVAQLRSWGLEARLEPWGEYPVGFDRGSSKGGMVAPELQDYEFMTLSWTVGTPGRVEAEAILEPEELSELEEGLGELAGRWVVRRPRGRNRGLFDDATRLLAGADIAGEVRDGGTLLRMRGNHRIEWDELPSDVRIYLHGDQHEELRARLEAGEGVRLAFDIDNRFRRGPVPLYNVVADLVGTEFPEEYVIVGGHSDSWDGAQGAQDNATGMATTLEAARLLMAAGARPRRTIRFMLWSGEEQGLFGSRAWVKANPEAVANTSCVLVHDGGSNYLAGLAAPAAMVDDLRRAFAPVADLDPAMPFAVSLNSGLRASGSSDHSPFISAGAPGFFWNQVGEADYGYVHHTQHDNLEHVVPEYQAHSALVVAVGAFNLANLDRPLSREAMMAPQPRRMGVYLDGLAVTRVSASGLARDAGWQEGDVLLSLDGEPLEDRGDLTRRLQRGGSRKVFLLRRGEEEVESTMDWSDVPGEEQRLAFLEAQRAERAAQGPEDSGEAGAGARE